MSVEHRLLAGLRFVDGVTFAPIERPLTVRAPGFRFMRNDRGIVAVSMAPGFQEWVDTFEPPFPTPPSVDFTLLVEDERNVYQSRQLTLTLPRADARALVDVTVFRNPWAPVPPNWTVVYGKLLNSADAQPFPAALLRLREDGTNSVLANTTAVAPSALHSPAALRVAGELALPVAGLPSFRLNPNVPSDPSDDTVTLSSFVVVVEAIAVPSVAGVFDPDVASAGTWQLAAGPLAITSGQRLSVGEMSILSV